LRRLFLLRHAKAEPGTSEQDDFDRALTERGRADAAAMARYLRKRDYLAGRIFCSTSLRTHQTAAAVLAERAGEIMYCDPLYLAPPGRIVALLHEASEEAVMVVGHNPGLEQCATLLAREPVQPKEQARHDLLEEKFPTAALAVLDFDLDSWSKLTPCSGRLIDFVRPRDLSGN
jgi:phosphohistidine phosphatase